MIAIYLLWGLICFMSGILFCEFINAPEVPNTVYLEKKPDWWIDYDVKNKRIK